MTEEALAAPAETAIVENQEPTQVNDAPEAPAKAEPTSRDAIERAFAKVDQEGDSETGQDKPVKAETGAQRKSDGTFKANEAAETGDKPTDKTAGGDKGKPEGESTEKTQDAFNDAPSRFSADAKEAWKEAPVAVRAEVSRALGELENGINQYREAFEPYREFHQQLQQSGQSFEQVIGHYSGIESMLAQDPLQGLDQICRNMGMDLQTVAAHVMGQPVDQQAQAQNQYVRGLEAKLARLEEQITGVSSHMESRTQQEVQQEISEFAKEHPRMDELATDIAFFIESGRAPDLKQAYEMAERLNPAPVQEPTAQKPAETSAKPAGAAHTRKDQLSLSGAPSTGSNPGSKKRSASTRDALDNAFAAAGL